MPWSHRTTVSDTGTQSTRVKTFKDWIPRATCSPVLRPGPKNLYACVCLSHVTPSCVWSFRLRFWATWEHFCWTGWSWPPCTSPWARPRLWASPAPDPGGGCWSGPGAAGLCPGAPRGGSVGGRRSWRRGSGLAGIFPSLPVGRRRPGASSPAWTAPRWFWERRGSPRRQWGWGTSPDSGGGREAEKGLCESEKRRWYSSAVLHWNRESFPGKWLTGSNGFWGRLRTSGGRWCCQCGLPGWIDGPNFIQYYTTVHNVPLFQKASHSIFTSHLSLYPLTATVPKYLIYQLGRHWAASKNKLYKQINAWVVWRSNLKELAAFTDYTVFRNPHSLPESWGILVCGKPKLVFHCWIVDFILL